MRKLLTGFENDQRASYPLGVMLARNIIDQAAHDAALHYAHVFQKATGRWQSHEGGISLGTGSKDAEAMKEWHRLVTKLLSHSRSIKDAVDNLSIFNRFPRWLIRICLSEPLTMSDAKHLEQVKAAIADLQKEGVDGVKKAA